MRATISLRSPNTVRQRGISGVLASGRGYRMRAHDTTTHQKDAGGRHAARYRRDAARRDV